MTQEVPRGGDHLLPQTGQSSPSRCALTLLAPTISRKKRCLCTREWHFTRCSLQTIQHTDSSWYLPPSSVCAGPFRGVPRGSAPHSCASHQATAQSALPAKGGTTSRSGKTSQLSVFFLELQGKKLQTGPHSTKYYNLQ